MRRRGWNLFSAANPPGLGVCIGEQHVPLAEAFGADLRAAAEECAESAPVGRAAPAADSKGGPYQAARRGVGEEREAAGRGAGCCSVRLRVAQGSSSGEHKFKLMSLLLGGADANSLQTFSLRVAASASETAVAGGRSTGTG